MANVLGIALRRQKFTFPIGTQVSRASRMFGRSNKILGIDLSILENAVDVVLYEVD